MAKLAQANTPEWWRQRGDWWRAQAANAVARMAAMRARGDSAATVAHTMAEGDANRASFQAEYCDRMAESIERGLAA